MKIRITTFVAFLAVAVCAAAQKQKLRDALSTKSGQPPGQWMTAQSKAPDGSPSYSFLVRGSPGVGVQWATMILIHRGGKWSSASVSTDREAGPKNSSVKVLLIVDGVTSAADCTTGDGQTLSFGDPAEFARLLMRSANVELGFLPPGAANAVGVNFDARGFRKAVASSPPEVRKSLEAEQTAQSSAAPAGERPTGSQPAAASLSAGQSEIEKALGKSYRNVKRVSDVQTTGKTVKVRFSINDNLTAGMIKGSAMTDIQRILKSVQSAGYPYSEISVVGTFPLKDRFGNSSEDEVVRATYKRSTVDRINWDGFDENNIYKIADSVWLAPAFQ